MPNWINRIVDYIAAFPLDQLLAHPRNPKIHPRQQTDAIKGILGDVGWLTGLIYNQRTHRLLDGHDRVKAAMEAGELTAPVFVVDVPEEMEPYVLATFDPVGTLAATDAAILTDLLRDVQTGDAAVQELLSKLAEDAGMFAEAAPDTPPAAPSSEQARQTLAERFGVPPFSVLDARQGYWQARKRAWLALGIQSEIGRDSDVTYGDSPQVTEPGLNYYRNRNSSPKVRKTFGEQDIKSDSFLSADKAGTSIFDPVLCELVYRWFCPEGGAVLDPFAGGSVRGIVAGALGRPYTGLDLRAEQIAANEAQAAAIATAAAPRWITGDSRAIETLASGAYDLVFSCPPYADLEVYSDDPADLSTLDYPAFLEAYRAIIAGAVALLHPDRFACFVVGDVRGPQGFYRNFVSDTIAAFEDAGALLYNEAILVTAVGSLPIRVGRQFEAGRKLGKTHQNVLVFLKGDPRRIKELYGAVEMGDPAGFDTDPAAAFGEVLA